MRSIGYPIMNKDASETGSACWKWSLILIPISCLLFKTWRDFSRERRQRHHERMELSRLRRCFDLFDKEQDLVDIRIKVLGDLKGLELDEEMRRKAIEALFAESIVTSECRRMIQEQRFSNLHTICP